jgi:hypothetical protein
MQDSVKERDEAQTGRNWLQNAKDFVFNGCGMYDVGRDARWNLYYVGVNHGIIGDAHNSHEHPTLLTDDAQKGTNAGHGRSLQQLLELILT